ncbi:hypothetical protein EGW08_006030 [Elysia chlorotica]|uniref:Transglutaminase-like domain-containing protein n=1 Tax=Elysia chlorotica TaxID=188477 RepID=A0A3S1BL45_ELYCH|nr:hypothetical protein EGW08_006030 [Elysia chlorotica]
MSGKERRASQQAVLTDLEAKAARTREPSCKTIVSLPDSGIAGSSSASYASSEAALLEGRHGSHSDLLASSLEVLEHVYQEPSCKTIVSPSDSGIVVIVSIRLSIFSFILLSILYIHSNLHLVRRSQAEPSCKTIVSLPDSGIAGSSSASYASSEAALLEGRHGSHSDLLASSLEVLEHVYQVRAEGHPTVTSLVKALTVNCHSDQTKAHALYRWLSGQSLNYYKCVSCSNSTSPTSKLKQLAEGKTSYASLYREMARCIGLQCEIIEGHVKGVHYSPGSPAFCSGTRHSWNAVSLCGHYALLDTQMGSLPFKFFLEHFFMTPPDEFCLSHFPKDKRWLLMARAISEEDFFGTLKTWPTMFAFNIRPLSMRSVIRTYDGRLSVTVLLRSVAVTPVLEYTGPGVAMDTDGLSLGIDQEIRTTDNAETFHMCLPQEGDYLFTLMVHDVEEDEDIPVFQYKIEYNDELL